LSRYVTDLAISAKNQHKLPTANAQSLARSLAQSDLRP